MNSFYMVATLSFTYFNSMSHFYAPWKRQKTFGYLTSAGSVEMVDWLKMGQTV